MRASLLLLVRVFCKVLPQLHLKIRIKWDEKFCDLLTEVVVVRKLYGAGMIVTVGICIMECQRNCIMVYASCNWGVGRCSRGEFVMSGHKT